MGDRHRTHRTQGLLSSYGDSQTVNHLETFKITDAWLLPKWDLDIGILIKALQVNLMCSTLGGTTALIHDREKISTNEGDVTKNYFSTPSPMTP